MADTLAHSRSAPSLGHSRSTPLLAAGQASLGGPSYSKGQLVQLTKPEVKKLRRRELNLKPYEDEKMGICAWRIDEMHECYDEARRKREELKKLYERRHQDVLRALADVRAHVVETVARMMTKIRASDERFMTQLAKIQGEFKWKCTSDHDILMKRYKSYHGSLDDLKGQLEVEARECTETLHQKRAELDVMIAKQAKWLHEQVKERKQGEIEFSARFRERFAELKERLAEEAEERKVRCDEEIVKAKKLYRELQEKQRQSGLKYKAQFEEIHEALNEEQEERAQAQEIVVGNMQGFFDQLEANISLSVQNQRAAQARLLESSGLAQAQVG
jgi:hypothetical protein